MSTQTPSHTKAGWPRAVIFDLDGTLIDSAPDIAAAVNAALAESGIVIDARMARRFIGDGSRKLMARVLDAHGHACDETRLAHLTDAFSACYHAQPCEHSTVFPGAIAALAERRRIGTQLAVCTNKPQPIAEQVMARLGLDGYLDAIVGAGTHALKPDPAPLIACLEALGCARDSALYVGDMAVDCQAGHAAGLPVLLADFGYARRPAADLGAEGTLAEWKDLEKAIAGLRPSAGR